MKKRREGTRLARGRAERRSPALRIACALAAVALALPALGHSIALATMRGQPERASAFAPWDGWITAADTAIRIQTELGAGTSSPVVRDASRALRREALAVNALAVLGTKAQLAGNLDRARALFDHATRLSRRNLQVQLSNIRASVDRGDIDGALYAYDTAFRTSSAAQTMLFPVLAAAIQEPKVREKLIDRLSANPSWKADFVGFAVRNSTRPTDVAKLVTEMNSKGQAVSAVDRRELVDSLYRAGETDLAWAFYQRRSSAPACGLLNHPRFESSSLNPSVFDWVPTEGMEGFATSDENSSSGLMIDAPPSTRGSLLRQVGRLCPGTYTLIGISGNLDLPVGSRLFWRITCDQGPAIGEFAIRGRADATMRYEDEFTVPPECREQNVELVIFSPDGTSGISGELASLMARPRGR